MIDWVATHRKHHQFSDTTGDPHSPHLGTATAGAARSRGSSHAHLGWVFSDMEVADERRYAKDLLADPWIRFVDQHVRAVGASPGSPRRSGSASRSRYR